MNKTKQIINNQETIPCKKCICVPICKHRSYNFLIQECIYIKTLLYHDDSVTYGRYYRKETFEENVTKLETYIKPTKWYTEIFQDPDEEFLTIQRIDDEL